MYQTPPGSNVDYFFGEQDSPSPDDSPLVDTIYILYYFMLAYTHLESSTEGWYNNRLGDRDADGKRDESDTLLRLVHHLSRWAARFTELWRFAVGKHNIYFIFPMLTHTHPASSNEG